MAQIDALKSHLTFYIHCPQVGCVLQDMHRGLTVSISCICACWTVLPKGTKNQSTPNPILYDFFLGFTAVEVRMRKRSRSVSSAMFNADPKIHTVLFGEFACEVWFPVSLPGVPVESGRIFVCSHCVRFLPNKESWHWHIGNCSFRKRCCGHEISRDRNKTFSVCVLDGRKQSCSPIAQRISLLTKLFLEHKMTLDDVHFFYYFALFETRADGTRHFCAYFSKVVEEVHIIKGHLVLQK